MNGQTNEESPCMDTDWSPPTDAEMKVLEARRERNNKISSLMGQYLLKGYKMLATSCSNCDCILLEDRQKNKFCIGCIEVDADTKKDNPAVSEHAARRTVEESQHRQSGDAETENVIAFPFNQRRNEVTTGSLPKTASVIASSPHASTVSGDHHSENCTKAIEINNQEQGCAKGEEIKFAIRSLREKLVWASNRLSNCTQIQQCINLVKLITETSIAIKSLREY